MAVDEEGNEIEDVTNIGRQSEKFIVNNREYATLPEAEAALREMEHSIKSAHDRILAEERQARAMAEEEDINWYSSHDPSLWGDYMPKLKYGDKGGYKGNDTATIIKKETELPNNKPAFTDSTKILEERLRAVETELSTFKQTDDYKGKVSAVNALNSAKAKYPYADDTAVKHRMVIYYQENNMHPTPEIVTQFMEQSHKRTLEIANKIKGNKTDDNPNPPVLKGGGGGVSEIDTSKGRPSLSKDPEGFKKFITDKLQKVEGMFS